MESKGWYERLKGEVGKGGCKIHSVGDTVLKFRILIDSTMIFGRSWQKKKKKKKIEEEVGSAVRSY